VLAESKRVAIPETETETETKKEKRETATSVATPYGVSPEVWHQFVKQRKVKKAQITDLVMAGIQREADKAGYTLEKALTEVVVRNWTSFKADWVAEKQQANGLTKTGLMNQTVMSGLTRGIMGSGKNVKFIEG
jgi:cytoskeletal protein RodZ